MPSTSDSLISTRERIAALQVEIGELRRHLTDDGATRTANLPPVLSLLLLRCGPLSVAVDARFCVEVLPRVALDDLLEPLPFVLGLLRLRGATVPVLDLCARLGTSNRAATLSQQIVVVTADSGLRGLLVEEALDMAEVNRSDIGPMPPDSALLALGLASFRAADQAFTLLDISSLFSGIPASS